MTNPWKGDPEGATWSLLFALLALLFALAIVRGVMTLGFKSCAVGDGLTNVDAALDSTSLLANRVAPSGADSGRL
jgi:hypothetical protein